MTVGTVLMTCFLPASGVAGDNPAQVAHAPAAAGPVIFQQHRWNLTSSDNLSLKEVRHCQSSRLALSVMADCGLRASIQVDVRLTAHSLLVGDVDRVALRDVVGVEISQSGCPFLLSSAPSSNVLSCVRCVYSRDDSTCVAVWRARRVLWWNPRSSA